MKQNQGEAAWIYRKVLRHPLLPALLGEIGPSGQTCQVGWGYRASGRAAMRKAARGGQKLLILEDAFVRSIRPGKSAAVYGLIADSAGIHYDSGGKSDLLRALETGDSCGWMRAAPFAGDDVGQVLDQFRRIGASKYNWFPGEFELSAADYEPGILVVDQSRGDMAIRFGGLEGRDFDRMLKAAFEEHEGKPVYLRAHPDHLFRAKRSCFSPELLRDTRIRLLSPDLSPAQCFTFCRTVMVGSSLMGMEAMIHGCKVVTFGSPFFAGLGLTDDRAMKNVLLGGRKWNLEGLFEMAYLRYGHYFDPDTREPCGLSDILRHLELQKERFRENRGLTIGVGFSPWKRQIVPHYLRSPAGCLRQVATMDELEKIEGHRDARILVWGRKAEIPAALAGRALRVEDGFLRSKGLGASFNFPYSWVMDSQGIYFDAERASDLEEILNCGFAADALAEAMLLIRELRDKRLTKYNLSGPPVALDLAEVRGRKVILVPGQVEADASIAFGSPELKSNLALLRRVREMEPDAYLVYKAHPDLVAGARHGSILPEAADQWADRVVTGGNVLDWLDLCDEVHTMTSTVGFEALIRQVPVVTYGMPFYAGWGLTTDRMVCGRRVRKISLSELVCGALMVYPRYLNPETGEFTTALKVARILSSDEAAGDRRAWNLKILSKLKKYWVQLARK